MARRIELPSTSELFDDPAPRPGRVAHQPAPAVQAAGAGPQPQRRRAKAPGEGQRPRSRSPQRPSPALTGRMSEVEGMLGDLPIDTLIDLRDGLELVLAGEVIDEKELAALLALGR